MAKSTKVVIKPNWEKGVVADLIAKDVDAQLAGAATFRKTWLGYVSACRNGLLSPANAEELLVQINRRMYERRKKNGDNRKPPAHPSKPKINETKTILGMHGWNCYANVFKSLEGLDVAEGGRGLNHGSLVIVARMLKSGKDKGGVGPKGKAYPKDTETAPSRDMLLRAIDARRNQRNKNVKRSTPGSTASDANYVDVIEAIRVRMKALAKWLPKNNGAARFFDAANNAIEEIAVKADAFAEANEKAAEA